MPLANALSYFFHDIDLARISPETVAHAKTLIIDALACMLAGAETEVAGIARRADHSDTLKDGGATIIPSGERVSPGAAALANGTMLRALDLMDVYVDKDVCHPSEAIPAALACAEVAGATGGALLETVIAALSLHAKLASEIPLHSNGLHHVGHAAWVVPLVAGRLLGYGEEGTAGALNLCAGGLLVPDGFSRGQVANVKALAYPLIARHAIELACMSRAGLSGQSEACEEVIGLLRRHFGMVVDAADLVPDIADGDLRRIWLKAYPAQYALQPLIATAANFRTREPERLAGLVRVVVRAGKRIIERTADRPKFRPASREAADHSLPFCLAVALLDGGLPVAALTDGRWRDADVLELMSRIDVEEIGDGSGFEIGRQEIELSFEDGSTTTLDCAYPPVGSSWRSIASSKLSEFAKSDIEAQAILEVVDHLEDERDLRPLVHAVCKARRPAHVIA